MSKTAVLTVTFFASLLGLFAQTNGVIPFPNSNPPPVTPAPALPPAPVTAPGSLVLVPPPAVVVPPANVIAGLVWDADTKSYASKPGEETAPFTFTFTNTSAAEIVINSAVTSCGCTVAQLPKQPWPIAPGATGQIQVTMNLAGKMGHVVKQVTVNSSEGNKILMVNVDVAAPTPNPTENLRGDRVANMEKAKADRQLVFKGDCRSCHVDKGVGKMSAELYAADCAVCHDSPHRASMVPDLRAPKGPRDHDFWLNWIAHGRVGSLMPAFAEAEGGPLSAAQIDSLVAYLEKNFPQGTPGVALPTAIRAEAK